MAPSNLIVRRDELVAVIDFGCCSVGDPDVTSSSPGRSSIRRSATSSDLQVQLDDDTWDRAKGWALWKALQVLAHDLTGGTSAGDTVRRFGWRVEPHDLIEELTKPTDR